MFDILNDIQKKCFNITKLIGDQIHIQISSKLFGFTRFFLIYVFIYSWQHYLLNRGFSRKCHYHMQDRVRAQLTPTINLFRPKNLRARNLSSVVTRRKGGIIVVAVVVATLRERGSKQLYK